MSRSRRRYRLPNGPEFFIQELRQRIAKQLQVDPDRIRYGPLPGDVVGKLGTDGDLWQIFYRDEWRELPWHFDSPALVTREMVIRWHGKPSKSKQHE